MYVINMDSKPERMEYMTKTFGDDVKRVLGVYGLDHRTLLDRLEMPQEVWDDLNDTTSLPLPLEQSWNKSRQSSEVSQLAVIREAFRLSLAEKTLKYFGAMPGELGCVISHLDAMKQAYEAGYEVVLIAEDDLGASLCPMWPASLEEVKAYADEAYPGWYSLRLQFSAGSMEWDWLEAQWWQRTLGGLGNTFNIVRRRLADTWGRWTVADNIPLAMRYKNGVGAGLTLWSRTGLEFMMRQHASLLDTEPIANATSDDKWKRLRHRLWDLPFEENVTASWLSPPSFAQKWKCTPGYRCVTDLMFFREGGNHTLLATPVLFTTRLGEDGSIIRSANTNYQGDGSHHLRHLQSTLSASKWLLDIFEGFRWGARNHLYPNNRFPVRTVFRKSEGSAAGEAPGSSSQ